MTVSAEKTIKRVVDGLDSLSKRSFATDLAVARYLRHRANDAINAETTGRSIVADDYARASDLRRAAAQLEGSPWPHEGKG